MEKPISGKRVAIVATDGFEESELTQPKAALDKAGAKTTVVSLASGQIQGMRHAEKGQTVPVDLTIDKARPEDFDALLLPGGLMNPDTLRQDPRVIEFVHAFFEEGKPVAAICHGPQILVEADLVRGRKLTSWPAIRTDLINAGADWHDAEVVVDNGLVTSRKPDDIPAFNAKMIEEFAEGIHAGQTAITHH